MIKNNRSWDPGSREIVKKGGLSRSEERGMTVQPVVVISKKAKKKVENESRKNSKKMKRERTEECS